MLDGTVTFRSVWNCETPEDWAEQFGRPDERDPIRFCVVCGETEVFVDGETCAHCLDVRAESGEIHEHDDNDEEDPRHHP
jgi:hypothetical protein